MGRFLAFIGLPEKFVALLARMIAKSWKFGTDGDSNLSGDIVQRKYLETVCNAHKANLGVTRPDMIQEDFEYRTSSDIVRDVYNATDVLQNDRLKIQVRFPLSREDSPDTLLGDGSVDNFQVDVDDQPPRATSESIRDNDAFDRLSITEQLMAATENEIHDRENTRDSMNSSRFLETAGKYRALPPSFEFQRFLYSNVPKKSETAHMSHHGQLNGAHSAISSKPLARTPNSKRKRVVSNGVISEEHLQSLRLRRPAARPGASTINEYAHRPALTLNIKLELTTSLQALVAQYQPRTAMAQLSKKALKSMNS